ncbi:chalcone isomerase family protein [Leucothrix arctica]|uniref:Chalcone isomerase n=1 Tax=Leucothrix arctica TaxID=1481894 RepID=A0A317C5V9_9GAMM|nr:chalcone isomerase family protein [Leucothrix arctica]PWQ93984.1 chalcone isomerase [Leucothrix arctica]
MKSVYSILLGVMLTLCTLQAPAATHLAGVAVPDTLKYGNKTMVHNGSGIRKKFFVQLYVGSLYLSKKSNDAAEILASEDAKAIRLVLISNKITIPKMKQAMLKGLHRATKGNLAPIQTEVDQILAVFEKGVAVNDVFDIINVEGDGLHVLKNSEKILAIHSPVFKNALFKMWLTNAAVDLRLRAGLLGM